MAQDFKAKQIRGSRLIVSRSNNTTADYMIYSSSAATDLVGGIQSDMLTKVGSDVFLFVSGNMGDGNSRDDVVLFGGDVVISGTFFAEKFVAEVDQLTNSDHFVSGSVFIQNKNATIGPHVDVHYVNVGGGSDTKVIDVALALQGDGRNALAFDLEADKDTAAAVIYERLDKLIFSSSKGFSFNRHDGSDNEIGSDTFLYVSGTIGGKEAGTGVAVFGGDTRVSGNLDVSTNLVVTGSSVFAGGSIFVSQLEVQSAANPLDKFSINVGADGATVAATNDSDGTAADLTLDADGTIKLDSYDFGYVVLQEGGVPYLRFERRGSAGPNDAIVKNMEDGHDLIFQQFDGKENLRLTDDSRVLVLSGGAGASIDEAAGADVSFYVSGSRGVLGKSTKGAAVFGGDMVVSGNLAAAQELRVTGSATFANDENFLAGYLRHLGNNDTNILFAGDTVQLNASSATANKVGVTLDGGGFSDPRNPTSFQSVVQINSILGGQFHDVDTLIYAQGGPSKTLFHGVAQTGNEQVLILSGGAGASVDESKGADVGFYVSGSQNSIDGTHGGVALFGGDIVVSGSFKQGRETNVSGQHAHAEGRFTNATGDAAHAEGENTLASGQVSHAEGSYTVASARGAHAEGNKTLAKGLNSHTEGLLTTGSGIASHAEGLGSDAVGSYSHAAGIYTIASGAAQSVIGYYNKPNTDSIFIVGNGGSKEARSNIFLVNTGSILLGSGNLGTDTFAFVSGALASRDSDTKGMSVFGGGVLISGSLVVSGLGKNGAASSGGSISGSIHHTQGGKSYIVGGSGISVLSESNGQITISAGSGLVDSTGASAKMVSFFSDSDTITGAASFKFDGSKALLSLSGALSNGSDTVADGMFSHAQGFKTLASGIAAHSEGLLATASANYSHAEGWTTLAQGPYSHAEGGKTLAALSYSHAEGYGSHAKAVGSHAEGLFTTASGLYSHAQGRYSVALGDYSLVAGSYTMASGSSQTAIGKYNREGNTTSLFVVGAGGHEGDRKDAFLVNTSSAGYSVHVGTGSNTKLVVTETGNVGIGTSNPNQLLHVNTPNDGEGIKSENLSTGAAFEAKYIAGANYGYQLKLDDNNNATTIFLRSYGDSYLNTGGNLGVGTTSPSGKVHIKSGESGQAAPSGFADDLIIEGSESTGISILTPNNSQGRIYFGDNDNEQRGYVLYDHALDVMKFSVANGNRMIIDQGGLSGSLTQLVDGSSYLKAGDGVTISSASNGSVTISAAGGSGGTIGAAEDGSYEDGLFTFFDSSTTIGTAIDRINEVLKFLAPSPATNVSDINAPALSGQTAFLSFGPGSGNNPTNYFGATVLAGNSLSSVDINGSYAVATGSSGDLRAGIFNASTTVAGIINSKVLQSDFNGGAVVNHVADSFGDGDKGTLSLILNGSTIVSVDLTSDSAGRGNPGSGATSHLGSGDHAATGFIQLSQTGSARTQGDAEFPVFKHRTGRYTVSEASQRKGYNSLKINHVVGSTTHTTNFVEWVYDKDGTNSNTPISANDPGFNIDTLDGGTNRFDMSGVRYAVTASGEYRVRVENYYKHVYATNAISNSITNSSIITTSPSTVPVIDTGESEDHTKSIHVTSSFRTTAASILGTTISGDVSVAHPTKTGLSFAGTAASGRFLIYSGAADSSTNTAEAFNHEAYRIQSGSYENQSDVTGGSLDWDSATHMTASNGGHSDGLQYYNGVLKSPKATLNSGDFRSRVDDAGATFFGAGHIYDNQPNYSGITGTRTYYRKIQNKTGAAIRDFKIQLNAGNTTIPTIVQQGTALDSQKIKVFARLPGEAGSEWLDLGQQFRYHTSSNRSGGRANVTLNTGGSPINFFTFGTGSVANNEFFVIKIEADAALTRDIGGITFTLPGIGGTPSAAPNVSTLNATNGTGVSGKLSFGSSKSIADFTNVTGGAGFEAAVDINGAYGISGNRYGIFDKSVAITGSINHDVAANGNSYPADAFGGGNAHKGQLKLEVNGSVVHTIELTSLGLEGVTNPGGSGFADLTTARNATGSNGLVPDFTKFWRTAKFNVATGNQRKGLNYARVIHSIDGSDNTTNYVEWVNDDDSSNLSLSNTTFSAFGESQETYFQSGVKYFTAPTGSFMSQVSHAYSNVYAADSDAILVTSVTNLGNATFLQVTGSGITNGHVSTNQMALPALDTSATDPQTLPIFVTASVAFNQSTSLPGTSPVGGTSHSAAARIAVKHPLNADQASGDVNVGGNSSKKFLVFSASLSPSNEFTTERFAREDYRIVSGNYVTQNSIVSGKWDSSKDMNNSANINYYNGLLVYNGHLISPNDSRLPNGNGDFRSHFDNASSNLISPLSNVNYASLPAASSSHRYYYRYFESNITSNVFDVDVTLFGDANIVGKSGALSGSLTTDVLGATKNIYVEGKIPGKTGWLDLGKASAGSGNITDGDGGLNGDIDQTVDSGGATNNLTFNGQFVAGTGVPPADRVLIRITAHKAWLGYINRIDISY